MQTWANIQDFRNGPIVRKPDAYNLYAGWLSGVPFLGFNLKSEGNTYGLQYCTHEEGFWIPGWHHVAGVFDKAAGRISLFMDGERVVGPFSIGQVVVNNSSEGLRLSFPGPGMAGVIEEMRLSDNVRYAANTYAVPSSPFECDENTRTLWHFDERKVQPSFTMRAEPWITISPATMVLTRKECPPKEFICR